MMVISRHRLPGPYRHLLTGLWAAPGGLLLLAVVVGAGQPAALLDLRLLIPLLISLLPAIYIWQEGVDVLPGGIRRRVHLPRYYSYESLEMYDYDQRPGRRLLTLWDAHGQRALECHAAHLTAFPLLLCALHDHLRDRRCPPNS
jgi:hypothetical protein